MFRGMTPRAWLFSFGVVLAWGCSGETHDSAARPASAPVLEPAVSPQAAVQAVLDGLKASKPVAFWDFLIPDQQASINAAVRELADVIDPEVWDRTVRNLKKLIHVLETKKEFLLDSPLWQANGIKLATVKASWTPAVKILKTIEESELVDRQQMKNFDGRAFLEKRGPALYAQAHELFRSMKDDPLKRVEDLKVTARKSDDQMASVVLESPDPKAKPIEFMMSVSHGKWLTPKLSLAIVAVVRQLSSYHKLFKTYYLADWKDEYLAEMDRLGKSLDQLEATKTSDEFQLIVGREILPVVLRNVSQFSKGVPRNRGLKAVSYQRNATTALVLIKGKHFRNESALGDLTTGFIRMVPSPQFVAPPQIVEGTTVVLVDPVEDLDVLAKSVATGRIVQVDKKRKTLVVELPNVVGTDKAALPAGAGPKSRLRAK
jgi:hypothetical protein